MPTTKQVTAALLAGVLSFKAIARSISKTASPIFLFHRVLPEGTPCYDPELVTSIELFGAFLRWVCERYRVLPLEELARGYPHMGNRSARDCAITFDGGWRDTFVHAFPLLQQYRVPTTVFLPVGFIGTNRRFWQERLWICLRELNERGELEVKLNLVARSLAWCPQLAPPEMNFERFERLLLTRPSEEAEQFVQRSEEVTGVTVDHLDRAFLNWDEVQTMKRSGITFGSQTLNHILLTRAAPDIAWREICDSHRELQ